MDYLAHYGIVGMKWGIRRYQNEDGSLTEEGKKRYNRDIEKNRARKKENQIDVSRPDPKRWVSEDINYSKNVIDETNKIVTEIDRVQENVPKKQKKRLDLSDKSDEELKQKIDREVIERRYNELFASEETNKAAEIGEKVIDGLKTTLSMLSSTASIAWIMSQMVI